MTQTDRREIFDRAIAEFGVSEVARRIGKSAPAVSQVKNGNYAGSPATIYELAAAEFGATTVACPVMGEVFLGDCLEARRRADLPFFPSSGQTAELHRACPRCAHNRRGA